MTPAKKFISNTGEPMLSARNAAKRLSCAPDYIGKLLREGKLRGTQVSGAWYVEESSLHEFEITRVAAKVERADELARLRREENQAYRKANGLPEPKKKISAQNVSATSSSFQRYFATLAGRNMGIALGGIMLFVAVAFAGAAAHKTNTFDAAPAHTQTATALEQIQSPFFGANPMSIAIGGSSQGSLSSNLFSNLFSYLFGSKSVQQFATMPKPTTGPTNSSTSLFASNTVSSPVHVAAPVQSATYPVIERTIEHTISGISEEELDAKLNALQNSLTSQIFASLNSAPAPYSSGGPTNNLALTQRIDTLGNVTITNATITGSTISGYLPLGGGTLTGALNNTTDATSTFAGSIELTSGCFSINGTCIGVGAGFGSVTSVDASGGTTGLAFTGGAITTSGVLTLSGVLATSSGGTGTSTAPAYGQVLVGNSNGGYDLVATSSLGIAGGTGGTGFSTTSADYWKTQNNFFSTTSASYFSDAGLAFSTTSAAYFLSQQNVSGFSTTSADYWKTQNNFFSTTSVAYWQSVTDLFSTTSSAYFLSVNQGAAFSTTSALYFLSQNQGNAFSTTSSNYAVGAYISASSTIPHIAGNAFGDLVLWDGTKWISAATSTLGFGGSGGGSVTSVDANGGSTGLTFTGGPITSAGSLTLGGLLGIANGGTGTSTAPAFGQLLIGNSTGGYDLVSTSSLGIVSGGSGFSTTSALYFSSLGLAFSTTSSDFWKTQNNFFSTSSVAYWQSVTDLFSTTSASYFLSQNQGNAFSTTSASNFLALNQGLAFSTTSVDFWKTQNNFFSTSSVDYWHTITDLFSTTSAAYFLSQNQGDAFSTTSAAYFASQNNFFSTTSAIYFVNSSTTIPKTYIANNFTALQQFNGGASTTKLSAITAYFGGSATSTFSTNGALTLAGSLTLGTVTGSTQCLRVNSAGVVSGTGSDCGSGGGGGSTTFLGLTDTPSMFTAGQIFFTNQAETSVVGDNTFTFDGTTLNAPAVTVTSLTVLGTSNVGTVSTGVWHGSIIGDAYVADALTIAGGTINNTPIGATTPSTGVFTNSTSTNATTTNLYVSGQTKFGSLTGLLYGTNGIVSAVSTSSLGLLGSTSLSATAPLAYDSSTGIFTISQADTTTDGYLSSADYNSFNSRLSTSTLGLFDKGYFFSTTSADYWKTQNNFFSTTSASYFSSLGLAFSTTSTDYWKTQNNFFSTTSASYFLSVNQGAAFSTTSAINFVNSSTTIPKTYTANTFTGAQTFQGGVTVGTLNGPLQANNGVVSATSSIGVLYGGTGLTSVPSFGNILVGNSVGGYTPTSTSTLGLLGSTSISATGPLAFNPATGVFSITQSGTGANGYVSSTDFNTFNNKISSTSLSATGPLSYSPSTGVFAIAQAGVSTDGYLSSVDWNSFNARLSTTTLGLFDKGYFFSTTSALAFLTEYQNTAFATSSADYWKSQRDFFSTTSAIYFANSSTTIPKTYTANTFTNSNTFNGSIILAGGTTIGSLTGPLQALNGVVSASSTLSIVYGGTGTSTAPGLGQVLLGRADGGYDLVATSSLGISSLGSLFATAPLLYNSGTGTFSIQDAQANGSTKGAATFASSDFNDNAAGLISIDYTNGQASGIGSKGFLSGADFTTFNNKISSTSLSGGSVISYTAATGIITTQAGTFGGNSSSVYTFPGDVITTGTATTSNLYISGKISGANLSACSGTTDKLLWNSSTQQFQCGTDAGASGSDVNWTHFNGSGIRVTTASDQVLIGFTSTSSLSKLEVVGGATIDTATTTNFYNTGIANFTGNVGIGSSSPSQKLSVAGGNILQTAFGNPTLASSTTIGGQTYASYVVGNYAYVADHTGGVKVLDITNPASSTVVGTYSGISAAHSIIVSGKYAYVGDSSAGLVILDVSNPASIVPVGSLGTGSVGHPLGLAISGKYVIVPNSNSPVVNIVDVSNPAVPAVVGNFSTYPSIGTPSAVAVSGKYVYAADTTDGSIYVADISNPAKPVAVSTFTGLNAPQSIYISGRFAYVADFSNGLYILDISNPAAITLAGSKTGTGYYSVQVAGDYAYVVALSGASMQVLDIHDPANITTVGTLATGGSPRGIFVAGKYAYVSAGNTTFKIVDINGAKLPSANIGSLGASAANITDNLNVGGEGFFGGGLNVGNSGIFSRGGLSVLGTTTLTDFIAHNSTTTNATTTSSFATTASSTNLFTSNLSVARLNGPLQANNGVVSATSSIGVLYGGTGLTTAPTYGQILLGNASGGYTLTSTSTLGLLGSTSISATGPLAFNPATGVFSITQSGTSQDGYLSQTDWNTFNNKVSSSSLSTFAAGFKDWNILSGALTPTSTLGIRVNASSTIGDGTQAGGLTVAGGATTTGTAYFAGSVGIGINAPSQNLQVAGNAIIGQSIVGANYTVAPLALVNSAGGVLKTQLNLVNTGGGGGAGSAIDFYTYTTAGNGLPESRIGSIDDGNYSAGLSFYTKGPGNTGNNPLIERLSVASGGNVGVGTTTPFAKLSVAGVGGDTNTTLFAVSSSTAAFATSTLFSINNQGLITGLNFNLANGSTTNLSVSGTASTTNLTISSILSRILKTDASGNVVAAVADTDYATPGLISNLKDWKIVNGYLTPTSTIQSIGVFGSSTIGNGAQDGGLTISGGATTTGRAYFAGNVGIGTTTPTVKLSVNGTVSSGGSVLGNYQLLNTAGALRGELKYTGSALDLNASTGPITFSPNATEAVRITSTGNVGIGNTNPLQKLNVQGEIAAQFFTATSTTASTFPYASTTAITASTASTTNLTISSILSKLLKTDASGNVVAAVADTDYATPGLISNLKDWKIVNGYLTPTSTVQSIGVFGSSTIGNGTQTGGLTISGGGTTTGNAYFGSQILASNGSASLPGISAFSDPDTGILFTGSNVISFATGGITQWSVSSGDFFASAAAGPRLYNETSSETNPTLVPNRGSAETGIGGTAGTLSFITAGVPRIKVDSTGNVGVGTTSPFAKLSVAAVGGETNSTLFAISSSTAAFATSTLFSINNQGLITGLNFNLANGSTTNLSVSGTASTTNLAISSILSKILKTDTGGNVVGAVADTDYATPSLISNFKDWKIVNGYLTPTSTVQSIGVFGSSTIGDGTTGLTVSGAATTTGRAYFAGNVGIGTTTPTNPLTLSAGSAATPALSFGDTGTGIYRSAYNTLGFSAGGSFVASLSSGGLFINTVSNSGSSNNSSISFGSGGATASRNIADASTAFTISQLNAGSTGNILDLKNSAGTVGVVTQAGSFGIGTTSPYAKLSVNGTVANYNSTIFAVASSTAAFATSTLFSVGANGSTTLFQIPSSLLKTDANGTIIAAVANTDYATPSLISNFHDWKIVNGYLTPTSTVQSIGVFGSSTIGNGTQTGGLTVSGGATTTQNQYVGGNLTVGGGLTTFGANKSSINYLQFFDGNAAQADLIWDTTGGNYSGLAGLTLDTGAQPFNIYGASQTYIQTGNVGIGVNNPTEALQVARTSGPTAISAINSDNGNSGALSYSTLSSRSRDAWSGTGAWGSNTVLANYNDPSLLRQNNQLSGWGIIGYNQSAPFEGQDFFHLDYINPDGTATSTRLAIDYQGKVTIGVSLATPSLILSTLPSALLTTDALGNVIGTSTLGVAYGGTASTTPLGGILTGNGTGAITSAIVSGPLSFTSNTLSISQSGTGSDGYLSSTDFNTFNNKISSTSLSATGPLSYVPSTGVFTIAQSGVSTDGYLSQGDWNSFNARLSTSTLALFDKGYFFSTTSAINFVNSSTTIPKTYTANTFTNTNTFADISTANATSTNLSVSGTASTTNLTISSVLSKILKTDSVGNVVGATADTDYATPSLISNLKDWKIVNGYLTPTSTVQSIGVFGSSTIGSGVQNGGLTVSGGATTTGAAYFASTVGIGTTTTNYLLSLGVANASNVDQGISLARVAGALDAIRYGLRSSSGGVYRGSITGTNGSTGISTELISFPLNNAGGFGNVGIGSTSPSSKLSVGGSTYLGGDLTATGTVAFTALGSGFVGSNNGVLYSFASTSITAASSTLLGDSNTFSGTLNTFTNAPKLGTLTGLVGGNAGNLYGISTTSLNASITGSAGSVANALTINNSGSGDASGSTFNGSAAKTISYNSIGAVPTTRNINTTFPLQGGGSLSGDLTLSSAFGTTTNTGLTPNQFLYTNSSGVLVTAASSSLSLPNAALQNSSITVNGVSIALGASNTIFAASSTLLANSNTFSGNNTFSGTNTFTGGTTLANATSTNLSVTGTASTTNLTISSILSKILKTDATGGVVAATPDVDYATPGLVSNFHDWKIVNGYLTPTSTVQSIGVFGSSTIGDGTQAGGLTVNGGATTTGNQYVAGNFNYNGSGTNSGANGILLVNNTANIDGSLRAIRTGGFGSSALFISSSGVGVGTATESARLSVAGSGASSATFALNVTNSASTNIFNVRNDGNVGIGTSTPFAKLSIAANGGDTNTTLFAISSSTSAFATSTLFSVSNTGTITTALSVGGVAVNAAGQLYTFATSTWTFASSTLLGDSNTFSGTNIFTNAPKLGSLNGLVAGNSGNLYALSTTSLNASITGQAGSVANALTINNSGSGDVSGSTFNGSAAKTISYNSIGAVPTTRNINTTFPLQGGGNLSGDLTLTTAFGTTTNTGLTPNQFLYTNASGVLTTAASSSLSLPNAALQNSSITVNGTVFNLGDSHTITAASSTLLANSNTFSGNNTFSGTNIFTGDTTLANATSTNLSVTGTASTTNLTISSILSKILKTDAAGNVVGAIADTDYATPALVSNFHDWKIVNGYLTPTSTVQSIGVFGSSTIGNGTQNGGLTISGGATTTGTTTLAVNGGYVGVGTALPQHALQVSGVLKIASDTNTGTIALGNSSSAALNVGLYRGTATGGVGGGNVLNLAGFDGVNITTGNTSFGSQAIALTAAVGGNIGIGTTSPYAKLSVVGTAVAANFVATTTAQNVFPSLLSTNATTTSLYIGTLTGPLQAVGGQVSATSTISPAYGGTGLSTLPSYGNLLVGNSSGGYTLTSTSSLGIVTSAVTSIGPAGQAQTGPAVTLATSTTGTDFTITATGNTITYNIPSASASARGLLASTDFTTFNNKISSTSLSATGPLSYNSATGVFSIAQAGTSQDGYLSQSDWNSFNSRLSTSTLGLFDKGYFFSTTSATNFLSLNRDWNIVAGALTPTTTIGIGVFASSTIGNGTLALTMSGNATTTGIAYFASNVGIGTSTPYAKLSVVGETVSTFFTATSTTATSTFAGGLNVGNGALSYDYTSGITSIDNLQLGATTFGPDSGILSWIDMPVTSGASAGTIESYSAQIDGNPLLTIYSESDGSGGIQNARVGVGTTSPFATFAVQGDGYITGNFTAANITATGTLQAANIYATGSTTLKNFTALNATTSNATTTGFAITGITSALLTTNAQGSVVGTTSLGVAYGGTASTTPLGGILTGNGTGAITSAIVSGPLSFTSNTLSISQANGTTNGYLASSDWLTFNNKVSSSSLFALNYASYPFYAAGNATTTLTQFNGGLTAYASSTIGNGTQAGGLTVSGGATTTGNAYFGGNVGIGIQSPNALLNIYTTSNAPFELGRSGNTVTGAIKYTTGTTQDWLLGERGTSDSNFHLYSSGTAADTLTVLRASGNIGLGNTNPLQKLNVQGEAAAQFFTATSTTASTFPYASTTVITATLASTTNLIVSSAGGTAGCATFAADGTLSNTGIACGVGGGAWPFTPTTYGATAANATGTLIGFTQGIYTTASSTIGSGAQNAGLTISGGATTTGNAYVAGNINISSFSAYQQNGNNILYASTTNHSTALGVSAGYKLYSDSGANYNTAIGESALSSNSLNSADRNNSIGVQSLNNLTTGSQNQALGVGALYTLTDGWNNVALGDAAGYYSQSADANVYIGADAGKGQSTQSQDNNVGIGYRSLYKISGTSGSNVALGYQAGYGITSGSNNIALGAFGTVDIITSGSNNVLIGQDVQAGVVANASNQLNIGNLIFASGLGSGSTISSGNVGIGTTTSYSKLTTWGSGSIFAAVNSASSTIFSVGQNGATSTNLSVSGTASTTNLVISSAGGVGTRCLQVGADGTVSANASACGSGGGASFGYPFPSDATTTVLTLTNGASIPKLTNLTTNGFVKTTGSNGTLTVDTTTYLSAAITAIGPAGQTQTGLTQTLATTSADANIKLTITASGDVQTFTPSWAGTLATSRGGLGGDFSASTGILSVNAGTVSAITTSAGLAAIISDETGTAGSLVFSASPTFTGTVGLPGLNVSSGLLAFTTSATTTIPNNTINAWSIATSTTASPLIGIDTTIGAEMVNLGSPGGDVIIGDIGHAANLVFEENSTIHGQGTNLLTFGTSGDRLNFAVNTGFGSTSPWGKVSIQANNGDLNTTLFAIGSSTASGTTTLLRVDNTGSTTIANGVNITGGCYAINGACFTGGVNGTWGQAVTFNSAGTQVATSSLFFASSTNIGVSTTTPWARLSIDTSNLLAGVPEFVVGSSTRTDFVITQSGNVGIHDLTPDFNFEIQGSSQNGYFGLTNTTDGDILTVNSSGFLGVGTTTPWAQLSINPTATLGAAPMFVIGSSTATRLILDNRGNLGLSTTSPWARFSIQANVGEAPQTLFAIASSSTATSSTLFTVDSSGLTTIGDPAGTGDANFQFAADANAWSVGYYSGDKSFRIASSTNLATNVGLLITKAGDVNIAPAAATSTQAGVAIYGQGSTPGWGQIGFNKSLTGTLSAALFAYNGTTVGSITYTNSATAYNTSSDRRIKDNIATTTLGLTTLMKLPVRDFTFKNDPASGMTTGFIAQELYEVFPYAVTTNGDNGTTTLSGNPWSVDYGRITPLIVSAVQDLNRKVDALASSGTTTVAALVSVLSNASSTATSTQPWLGVFASASQTLKDAMSGFSGLFVQVFKDGIYASAGIFDKVFAQTITAVVVNADTVNTKTLCLDGLCVTKNQLQQLLNNQNVAPIAPPSGGGNGGGGNATTTPPSGDPAAPIVSVQGANPAILIVGDSYIDLGAIVVDDQDDNLGYLVSLDGGANMTPNQLSIDTSAPGTHTITYTATDTQGNVGTANRTVIVQAPITLPPPDEGTGTSTDNGGDTSTTTPQQ